MGQVTGFAKRRIAGYLVFWAVVLFIISAIYRGTQPAQAGVFILAFAFTASMSFASRMKRKQRDRREADPRLAR